jgi:hypothetical protein
MVTEAECSTTEVGGGVLLSFAGLFEQLLTMIKSQESRLAEIEREVQELKQGRQEAA